MNPLLKRKGFTFVEFLQTFCLTTLTMGDISFGINFCVLSFALLDFNSTAKSIMQDPIRSRCCSPL